MDCLVCGHDNPSGALACGLCGELLVRPQTSVRTLAQAGLAPDAALATGDLAGPAYTAGPANLVLYHSGRATRFLVFTALLVLVAALFPLAAHLYHLDLWGRLNMGLPPRLVGGFYLWLLFAFLVGQTARATGMSFWSFFTRALFPPLVPWAWAAVAGARWWKPYALGGATLAVALGLSWPLREVGWAVELVWLAALPFLISAWMGGSVIGIARVLGLNSYLAGAWVCILPALILGTMFWYWDAAAVVDAWLGAGLNLLHLWHNLRAAAEFGILPLEINVMAAGWAFLCLMLWIKAIHDNLRFPVL